MNRDQKATAIAEIAAHIDESQAVFAVDYRGISVPQVAELRAKLRESDATFKVVKNSLTERAADQVGAETLKELLEGPTALTFVRGDIATAAKAVADYGRATQLLPFKGGLMDGAAIDPDQIRSLSRLPSREVLYGQLVGVVASPISGLVRTLGALVGGLAVALETLGVNLTGLFAAGAFLAVAAGFAMQSIAQNFVSPAAEAQDKPQDEAPAVEEAPEDKAEPEDEPAQDDNQAEASADDQAKTADANPKED